MKLTLDLLNELVGKYGDSLYIMDFQRFKNNYEEFFQAFNRIYDNSNIAYSYKTNYTPNLCRHVYQQGGYAEVVSIMEYDLALKIGVRPEKIIFNGPFKKTEHIEKAALKGSIVNLDSEYEVTIIESIAKRFPQNKLKVGLRCNFALDSNDISRFGFDTEDVSFDLSFKRLSAITHCEILGLHCHFSTFARDLPSYQLRAKKMIELSQKYFTDKTPAFIDVGGGFFSKMSAELKKQFDFTVHNYNDYAKVIATEFNAAFQGPDKPELLLEPGAAITADIMSFVAKVIGTKSVRGKHYATVSGSLHNIQPIKSSRNLPMSIYRDEDINSSKKWDIVGYTCLEVDVMFQNYIGGLKEGDFVVFDNVGAYTIVLKPPFILPCPPVIEYDFENETAKTIKRREQVSDIFSTFNF